MAKPRETVAASALDELLTNQAAAIAGAKAGEDKTPAPATPAASKPKNSKPTHPSTHPQQTRSGSAKTGGEDGKKTGDKTGGEKDCEILYAKIPAELMKAMKLHLMFGDTDETTITGLVISKLYPCFKKELSEVQTRSVGA